MINWQLVKRALDLSEVDPGIAEIALREAIKGTRIETGDTTVIVPAVTTEQPVVYGQNGYTDDGDPRGQSARGHAEKDGKVTGLHVNIHTLPDTKYRCTDVTVLSEDQSEGQTVVKIKVTDKAGRVVREWVALATGYGGGLNFDHVQPTNAYKNDGSVEHDLTGVTFMPPNLGPGAVFVSDSAGDPISDVVANLGLPGKRHIVIRVSFQER